MEYFFNIIKQVEPIQWILGVIAICGGIARYLNSFANGTPFSFGILFASAFVAGFSGWVFAQIGLSMQLRMELIFMMSGVGGFFGEQTMKLAMEFIKKKVS